MIFSFHLIWVTIGSDRIVDKIQFWDHFISYRKCCNESIMCIITNNLFGWINVEEKLQEDWSRVWKWCKAIRKTNTYCYKIQTLWEGNLILGNLNHLMKPIWINKWNCYDNISWWLYACGTDEMMDIEVEISGRRLLLGHWNPMISTGYKLTVEA